jgi:hypothetical protein
VNAIVKYKAPILVVSGWLLALILLSNLLGGCQPGTKPSTFDVLSSTESTLTTAANTLNRALQLGTITVDDPDYARAYSALESAGELMDTAWAAYRAGNIGQSEVLQQTAMDAYLTVRPIITRLAEGS